MEFLLNRFICLNLFFDFNTVQFYINLCYKDVMTVYKFLKKLLKSRICKFILIST